MGYRVILSASDDFCIFGVPSFPLIVFVSPKEDTKPCTITSMKKS